MQRFWGSVLACLASLSLPSVATSQTYEGPRLLSLAEAQRAFSTGNDSIYLNPAGLALSNAYSIELGAVDDLSDGDRRFNLSITDSNDKPVAGGIAYTFRDHLLAEGTEERRRTLHEVDLALAARIADNAALGVTARYLTASDRAGDVTEENGGFSLFTLDAGVQWQMPSGLALGLTGYNLTNSDRLEAPISWGAGVGYRFSIVSLETDIRYNAKIGKPRFSAGGTLVIAQMIPLRAGFAYDRADDSTAISAGLGYMSPNFEVDLGFRQKLSGEVAPGTISEHVLGLAIRLIPFL